LRGRKRHTYEGGIRVPGLVRWPKHAKPNTTSDEPVIGSDIFTTVCEILEIPLPTDRTIDGASLLPLFEGKAIERKQPLYWRNHLAPADTKVALRVGDWKILGSDDLFRFELYNIQSDPQETTELSAQQPAKFQELKLALIQHDAQVLREGPDWWKHEKPVKKKAQPRGANSK
jgi:arylsulfatase A-like enzyme